MLTHPTLEKLHALHLSGMVKAFEEQTATADIQSLSFEERLGLMVDREMTERDNRRLRTRLRKAKLRLTAAVEDIDYRHPRGLDKAQLTSLASCRWIQDHDNLILTGKTGTGKSYIACALGQKACREGYTAVYLRLPRLCQELAVARGDGRYGKLLATYAKTDLLILDDWGITPLNAEQRRDLLEILDDRYAARSTLVAGQLPVERWHDYLEDPTIADAILDRLIHNAHRITLRGESMRKKKTNTLTKNEASR